MARPVVVMIILICMVPIQGKLRLCGDQSNDELQVFCGEETECYKDNFNNKGCKPKGSGALPSSLCLPEDMISITDEVAESCNPWDFDHHCPAGQVCCLTQSGHKCMPKETFQIIRQDADLDIDFG